MIDFINRSRNDHIITIEDPIEFSHEDINCVVSQREIGHDSSNFASALRAALREDPDVILVGEMRDPETMAVGRPPGGNRPPPFSTLPTPKAPRGAPPLGSRGRKSTPLNSRHRDTSSD